MASPPCCCSPCSPCSRVSLVGNRQKTETRSTRRKGQALLVSPAANREPRALGKSAEHQRNPRLNRYGAILRLQHCFLRALRALRVSIFAESRLPNPESRIPNPE